MDSNRFDDLTRTLGGGQSRRRMLKALGGAALAAAALTRIDGAEAAACKSPNVRCGKGKDAVCVDPASFATDEANCGACGHRCDAGSICCGGGCVQTYAGSIGDACCGDADCGGGELCHSSYHVCFTPPGDLCFGGVNGIPCLRQEDCCGYTCITNPDPSSFGSCSVAG